MAENIARVGDMTNHGGKIITGSDTRKVGGIAVARLGDSCTCPTHGPTTIAVVTANMPNTDGIPTAHSGAMTGCGARILPCNSMETQDTP